MSIPTVSVAVKVETLEDANGPKNNQEPIVNEVLREFKTELLVVKKDVDELDVNLTKDKDNLEDLPNGASCINVMEPRLRASPEHFSVLIDFMERYGDLSRPPPGLQGRIRSDELWQQLTVMLNSLGGGVQKSSDKWKKVWADWKTKTKKKYLSLMLQASRTDGPSRRISLTTLEERVVAVMRVPAAVGQAGIQEQSFHPESSKEVPLEHVQYEIMLEDHDSQNIAMPTSPAMINVDWLPQPEEDTPASPASLPPLPRSPPARNSRRQASASPRSSSTSRRTLLRARRNRALTPFERAADLFTTVEQKRLELEETRDKRLHEREMERLRLEAERIDVTRQQNNLLHQLSLLGQRLIDVITQQRPSSLPSTNHI